MTNIFTNLTSLQRNLVFAIMAIIIYAAATATSYSIFASQNKTDLTNALPGPSGQMATEESGPLTENCVLNGTMHNKMSKETWSKRRPLAVMIENSLDARPQSGLTSADIIYEAVAEGGITRFMAIFYCNPADVQVGPVRSARTYFIDWLLEYDALYAHVGGANCAEPPMGGGCQNGAPADALGQIIRYKIKDLNQFGIGYPTYWRDYQRLGRSVATEHTMYSSTQKLWDVGAKKSWTNVDDAGVSWDQNFTPWKFQDDIAAGITSKIQVNFWANYKDYVVDWTYDPSCKCYKRKNGGVDHIDFNNKKPLSPKTVVVQFEKESPANDGYENNLHLLYGTIGKGKALIFENGNVTEGQWTKASRTAREKFLDQSGKEMSFLKGQIW